MQNEMFDLYKDMAEKSRAFIILCHRKFVSHSHSPQGPPA